MQFDIVRIGDLEEIGALRPEGWNDIRIDFKMYIESPISKPIKVMLSDKIVGVGASIEFPNSTWLAHIIVNPEFRNRGIGYKIVEELINNSPAESYLLTATEIGFPVYVKAGFRAVGEYKFFQREGESIDFNISKNVVGFREEFRTQILDMDRCISGENREQLIANYLHSGIIYVDSGNVLGYYLPDLKEGFIFAETDHAGIELMKYKYRTANKAALPADNVAGINFLKQIGFAEIPKKGTRMVLGKDIYWIPEKIFSRIGGNLG